MANPRQRQSSILINFLFFINPKQLVMSNTKTSNAFNAATQIEKERKMLRNHLFNTFQGLTDYLKDTYGEDFSYVRRYTYVGPRVARTKFYGANWVGNSETAERITNSINTRYKGVMTAAITGADQDSVTVYLNS